jgi:hypothetical protein
MAMAFLPMGGEDSWRGNLESIATRMANKALPGNPGKGVNPKVITAEFTGGKPGTIRVQLTIEKVNNMNKRSCLVLWGRGALV